MFFQINGLSIQNLQKADDKLIKVDIVANHLTRDDDGETVLKEAFDKQTVKNFLDIGVIEFWHESKNPALTKEAKNRAIIGKPIAFRWENGKPTVTAQLTKSHPIVETMYPHLEAQNPVYAASIGGSKMVMLVTNSDGQKEKIIPKIKWDHLAIAPCNAVINREHGVNVRLLEKARDIIADFNDMDSFKTMSCQILSQEQELRKALEAPESVDSMYNTPGGALSLQDLEGKVTNLALSPAKISGIHFSEKDALKLIDTMLAIKNGLIPADRPGYYKHFSNDVEFADKSYRLFNKFFKN